MAGGRWWSLSHQGTVEMVGSVQFRTCFIIAMLIPSRLKYVRCTICLGAWSDLWCSNSKGKALKATCLSRPDISPLQIFPFSFQAPNLHGRLHFSDYSLSLPLQNLKISLYTSSLVKRVWKIKNIRSEYLMKKNNVLFLIILQCLKKTARAVRYLYNLKRNEL